MKRTAARKTKAKRNPLREQEHHIQKRIVDLLRAAGAEVIENRSQKFDALLGKIAGNKDANGTVDIIAAIPGGLTLWIEVKTLDGVCSTDQKRHHERLVNLDHLVMVACDHTELAGFADVICKSARLIPHASAMFFRKLRSL